jgi:hypothetical protein
MSVSGSRSFPYIPTTSELGYVARTNPGTHWGLTMRTLTTSRGVPPGALGVTVSIQYGDTLSAMGLPQT